MKLLNRNNWKVVLTWLTFAALIGLIIAVHKQIFDTLENLTKVNAWALLAMPVWQFIDYHCYAKMYQHMYRLLGERIRYRPLYRVSLELNFVNNLFPSGGVSGISYF